MWRRSGAGRPQRRGKKNQAGMMGEEGDRSNRHATPIMSDMRTQVGQYGFQPEILIETNWRES